jgi:hypothetical protein
MSGEISAAALPTGVAAAPLLEARQAQSQARQDARRPGPCPGAALRPTETSRQRAARGPFTHKLVAAMREAAEQEEQAVIKAALFTAKTEEERRVVLDVLGARARNRAARAYS